METEQATVGPAYRGVSSAQGQRAMGPQTRLHVFLSMSDNSGWSVRVGMILGDTEINI